MKKFLYFKDAEEIKFEKESIVVELDNVDDKTSLFKSISTKLNFPFYFGNNFDSLYELLNDLSWLGERAVIIVHKQIPFPNDSRNKNIYVRLLFDVINDWGDNDIHEVSIYFPEKYRSDLERALVESRDK